MRVIAAAKLKNSLGKHLELSAAEDMFVKKNGEIVTDNAKGFHRP